MARRKRTSDSLLKAQTRIVALESIDAALDLGNGMTLVAYRAAITDADAKLAEYNTKLSEADGLLNVLEAAEAKLDDLSGRMLSAVAVKYGKDSDEYEKAGGTKSSERKSPRRKPQPATA